MVIFRFWGQNGLKLELRTFAVHKILMEHEKEGIKWIYKRKKTIIKILASFPRQKLYTWKG